MKLLCKMQQDNTIIPTPAGYTTMGAIQIGDTVFSDTGKPCRVLAKSAIDYSEQAYRITFKDGETIEAGERHEWVGKYTRGKRRMRTMTTGEIYRMPRDNGCIRFRIPVAAPIKTSDAVLPVEPYLMGYWLGNGNAVKPEITIKTEDIAGVLKNIIPFYEVGSTWRNIGDSIVCRIPALRTVLLRSFREKVIPAIYLRSSKEQRIRLLCGLMDSDVSVSNVKGQAIYTSTEKALSKSVSELLWSLGIKTPLQPQYPRNVMTGTKRARNAEEAPQEKRSIM